MNMQGVFPDFDFWMEYGITVHGALHPAARHPASKIAAAVAGEVVFCIKFENV